MNSHKPHTAQAAKKGKNKLSSPSLSTNLSLEQNEMKHTFSKKGLKEK